MGTITRSHTFVAGEKPTDDQWNVDIDQLFTLVNGNLDEGNVDYSSSDGIVTLQQTQTITGTKTFDAATTFNTSILPDSAGASDIGTASAEWGDVYIADDKFVKFGSDQNVLVGYDETTTDSLKFAATEGAGLAITLMADEGDDAGDEWKLNVADGGVITLGNDIASAGSYVTHLTLTPHATVSSSTLALAGALTVAGTAGITGVATVGGLTIGSAVINEAELETIDGVTAGTVAASKAVVVDSNKDIGSFRNVTLTGELDAATGDFSGDVDVDGTLEADAITLGGTALGSLYSPIAGSSSIVTVGTIGTGTWQGTAVASAYLDADTAHLSTTQTFTGDKTFTGTVTVGADDTGKDVKFFGASAGAYMEWDESADQLRLMGASADATTSTGKLLLATSLTDINANDVLGKIDFQAPHEATGTDAIAIAASIQAVAQATFTATVNATDLIFYTGHSEAATEKFRMTSQGELGVGGANYGTDGQVLTSGGAGAAPAWEDASGGTFSGPGSSTDNAVVRFNGTGGATGQNSGVTIDDSNNITGAANVTLSGELDAATGDFSGIIDVAGAATLASLVCTAGGTFGGGYGSTGATISTAGVGQFNGALTTDGTLEANAVTIGGTALLANDTNNRVTTATGSGTFNGEANLTFDGTTLAIGNTSAADYLALRLYQGGGTTYYWDFTADVHAGDLIIGSNDASFDLILNPSYGKVGIGTTSPNYPLDVRSAAVTESGFAGTIKSLDSTALAADTGAGLLMGGVYQSGGGQTSFAGIKAYKINATNGDYGGGIKLYTRPNGSNLAERMRIDSSGAIMVGKTASNVGVVGTQIETGGNINLTASGDRLLGLNRLASTGDLVSFKYAGSEKGSISTDGTNTAFNTSSDYRLKENIISLTGALTRVAQLQPRRFNFKETPDVTKDGFIAHEASDVVPEAVTGTKDATKTLNNVIVDSDGAILDEGKTEAEWTSGKERTLVSEATEAIDAVLYVDGDEIPDGKSVGDVKTPAIDAADAVYADPAYAADTVWHETLTVPEYQGIDQAKLVPLLTAAIQELTARVAALESA